MRMRSRAHARTHKRKQCNILLDKTDPGIYMSGPIVLSFV